jgi:Arc/MetJ-type ribon-helix-helix transcriptional regulator
MKAGKSKNINVRLPLPLYERVQALIEEKHARGEYEVNLSDMVRTLIKVGCLELETR